MKIKEVIEKEIERIRDIILEDEFMPDSQTHSHPDTGQVLAMSHSYSENDLRKAREIAEEKTFNGIYFEWIMDAIAADVEAGLELSAFLRAQYEQKGE